MLMYTLFTATKRFSNFIFASLLGTYNNNCTFYAFTYTLIYTQFSPLLVVDHTRTRER